MAESNQSADVKVGTNVEPQTAEQETAKPAGDVGVTGSVNESASSSDEKSLPQSEVNKIVGGVKVEAYERGKREALAEHVAMQEKMQPAAGPQTTDSGKVSLSKEEINRMIEEKSTLMAMERRNVEVANQFMSKMGTGESKHKDFEEVVGGLDVPNLPMKFVEFANSMDNTADVMYELGKNPTKFVSVLALSGTNPNLAYREFTRLSGSIKRNSDEAEKASKTQVKEPLTQIKPSLTGTDDGELKTASDFKKQPWLRG